MKQDILKYNLVVENGNINDHYKDIRQVMFSNRDNRAVIYQKFGRNMLFLNNSIYTVNMISEPLIFTMENGKNLRIAFDHSSVVKSDTKSNIIGRLIKILLKKLRLKPVGRKLFDIKQSEAIKDFEIWPGFSPSFVSTMNNNLNLLNIDLVHKVITNQNVLKLMEMYKDKFR